MIDYISELKTEVNRSLAKYMKLSIHVGFVGVFDQVFAVIFSSIPNLVAYTSFFLEVTKLVLTAQK